MEQTCSAGGQAEALQLDICDEDQVEEAVSSAVERFGRLDILINNAGIDVTVPVDELSIEEWDRIMGVNLRAPFLLSRLVFRHMKDRGRDRSSISSPPPQSGRGQTHLPITRANGDCWD